MANTEVELSLGEGCPGHQKSLGMLGILRQCQPVKLPFVIKVKARRVAGERAGPRIRYSGSSNPSQMGRGLPQHQEQKNPFPKAALRPPANKPWYATKTTRVHVTQRQLPSLGR